MYTFYVRVLKVTLKHLATSPGVRILPNSSPQHPAFCRCWGGFWEPGCVAVSPVVQKLTTLAKVRQTVVWWSRWTRDMCTHQCMCAQCTEGDKENNGGSPSDPGGHERLSEGVPCKLQLKGKKAPAVMSHTENVRSERWAGL